MELTWIDFAVFVAFLAVVMTVSMRAARNDKDSIDYFLAGRSLPFWLIGFSLIASNISTEHFVGMAGSAYGRVGLAIASYEWMAAVTLVIVALFFLPRFLQAGICTMPEFLEYRYDRGARTIMAVYLLAAYVIVFLATVLYSGAVALVAVFDLPGIIEARLGLSPEDASFWAMVGSIWAIGLGAGVYTIYGGLKAVVWSDLLQGGALLLGGAIVLFLGLQKLGEGDVLAGWSSLLEGSADKLHTVLPWDDPDVPWLAVFVGGLWIPNLFYWGLNQFITQRTLGAKSLAEGQKGIFLAAGIKLLIPFLIVFPGILAFRLYGDSIANGDAAYPTLMREILPPSLRGILFAALAGAVMSSFNSGINSASTIFTVDLWVRYVDREASPRKQVKVGRISTAIIIVVACLWAPVISRFEGVFAYIQEIWGFISPSIVAVFVVGLIVKRAPPVAARGALLLGVLLYALCRIPKWIWDAGFATPDEIVPPEGLFGLVYAFNSLAFLHHMGIVFLVLVGFMLVVTRLRPLAEPRTLPVSGIDVTPLPSRFVWAGAIVVATAGLYVAFW